MFLTAEKSKDQTKSVLFIYSFIYLFVTILFKATIFLFIIIF